jgi:hypothetical protein
MSTSTDKTPAPPQAEKSKDQKSKGQQRSQERGTATNHKKSPGKRPSQGGH